MKTLNISYWEKILTGVLALVSTVNTQEIIAGSCRTGIAELPDLNPKCNWFEFNSNNLTKLTQESFFINKFNPYGDFMPEICSLAYRVAYYSPDIKKFTHKVIGFINEICNGQGFRLTDYLTSTYKENEEYFGKEYKVSDHNVIGFTVAKCKIPYLPFCNLDNPFVNLVFTTSENYIKEMLLDFTNILGDNYNIHNEL